MEKTQKMNGFFFLNFWKVVWTSIWREFQYWWRKDRKCMGFRWIRNCIFYIVLCPSFASPPALHFYFSALYSHSKKGTKNLLTKHPPCNAEINVILLAFPLLFGQRTPTTHNPHKRTTFRINPKYIEKIATVYFHALIIIFKSKWKQHTYQSFWSQ